MTLFPTPALPSRCTAARLHLGLLALAACAAGLAAQTPDPGTDRRPVAFTNARLVPIDGVVIERGTLVVRNGVIEALGASVTPPAGARIVDAEGCTILPGLVSAWSRAGLSSGTPRGDERPTGRRPGRGGQLPPVPMPSGGSAQNKAATKVVDGLYAKQPVFGDLLRTGVTTLGLMPTGSGCNGLGAVLRPDGKTLEQLVVRDDAVVVLAMGRDAATKKLFKESFEKAQKLVEERKKPPEPPAEAKPAEAKPSEAKDGKNEPPKGDTPPTPNPTPNPPPNPTPTPPPAPKPEGNGQNPAPAQPAAKKPEAPKDPNLEVLADLLEGKRRAMLQIDSAADLLHWQHAVGDKLQFPRTVVVTRHDPNAGTLDVVLDQVKALSAPVLLPPEPSTQPRSRVLVHPARALHEAGLEVGFLVPDSQAGVRTLFARLVELVRLGLPADVALRGVTLTPAKALGVEAKKGSLAVGKDADLLVFRGDPMAGVAELHAVWLAGREVAQQP